MLYALGVIDDLGFMYEFDTVVIHIYQPRIKNYSSWQTSTKYLLEWAEWVSQRAKRDTITRCSTHTKRKGLSMV